MKKAKSRAPLNAAFCSLARLAGMSVAGFHVPLGEIPLSDMRLGFRCGELSLTSTQLNPHCDLLQMWTKLKLRPDLLLLLSPCCSPFC